MAVGATTANTAPASSTSDGGLTTSGQAAGASTHDDELRPATGNAGLITLDVTPRQAEQIAQGTALGTFYLTLDAPGLDPSKFTPPAEIVETLEPVRPAPRGGRRGPCRHRRQVTPLQPRASTADHDDGTTMASGSSRSDMTPRSDTE